MKRDKLRDFYRRIFVSRPFEVYISLAVFTTIAILFGFTFKWFFLEANWEVVSANLPLYLFGIFPDDQRWRPATWLVILICLSIVTIWGPRWWWLRKILPLTWIGVVPLGIFLLSGGLGILPVASRSWGGLTLTIFLMMCSSLIAFPLGVILAIARQSELPIVKYLSAIYIEVIRAIPLIAVLFFGQLLIPLFLPLGLEINRVSRAIFAFSLFVAAYVAEDIRGGLQSIPISQEEAAKSLGLSKLQITWLILVPQALIIALPALGNQAIGLLQNTTLMAILGLVELLGISQSLLANPAFIGSYIEVYLWLAFVYWFVCTFMALLSRHLEKTMSFSKPMLD
ncbi:amino acid ABC transporter permease [Prochlorococcus sp. MIT 1223]|uniref:amino acid ABC transporter permease n=1 Tax=Prochlorococcus sp. MIT 1223 TaxID=3096217 RepID=UPI002A7519A3|nr:amino acid ABC transporter permease [Prochlorococcus sp. MIT 1223]